MYAHSQKKEECDEKEKKDTTPRCVLCNKEPATENRSERTQAFQYCVECLSKEIKEKSGIFLFN